MRTSLAWLSGSLLAVSMSLATAQQPAATNNTNSGLPTIADVVDPKNDTESARVNSINFYGNQKLSRDQLLSVVGITAGQVMQQELMGKGIAAIKARYAASGLQVEVRPRVSHPKQNFVDVNFLITENGSSQ